MRIAGGAGRRGRGRGRGRGRQHTTAKHPRLPWLQFELGYRSRHLSEDLEDLYILHSFNE